MLASISRWRVGRHLDDHALDAAGQPRDQLFAEDRLRPLRVTDAPPDNWAKIGDMLILADKLAGDVFKQARVTAFEKSARRLGRRAGGDGLRASAARAMRL